MFFKFICAVVTRSLFILVSLIGVWRVVWVKDNGLYWFLTILYLPLVAEMILTLKRRRGNDYKWFSPAIFLFLISIIPSLWILELHHQDNKSTDSMCEKLDSTENIKRLFRLWSNSTNGSEPPEGVSLSSVCANDWILALHQILLILLILGKWLLPAAGELTRDQLSQLLLIFVGTAADILEFTSETLSDINGDSSQAMVYIILAVWTWSMLQFPLHFSVCANDWILALHQILLILLILGKWLLPAAGELTRDQLSQLLLIFVGTAADILEFTSETLSDINGDSSQAMVYIILAVWTWSMLQFPLHFSVMGASSDDLSERATSLLSNLRTDIWSTVEALFIQDGPFLVVRLTVMIYFNVVHQMLIFFAIKNFLVVILNIYRLSVLICDKTS